VNGERVVLSRVLRREPIGLKYQNDGSIELHYGPLELGTIARNGKLGILEWIAEKDAERLG